MYRTLLVCLLATALFTGCQNTSSPTIPPDSRDLQLSLTAEPDSLPSNTPGAFSTVSATITDLSGYPVGEGNVVNFTTTLGTIGQSATTDANGIASVRLAPGVVPGVAEIEATIQSRRGPIKGGARVCVVDPALPVYIEVSANPPFISVRGVGGVETSVITAVVRNGIGGPVTEELTVSS